MPNEPANRAIAEFTVAMGWFQSQGTSPDLPTDNWRLVKDGEGRAAIMYVEFFRSNSNAGEPRDLPNHKHTKDGEGTLPKLRRLNQELPNPKSGPFIALAELTSDDQVVNIRVWNLAAKLAEGVNSLSLDELREPLHKHPRIVGALDTGSGSS